LTGRLYHNLSNNRRQYLQKDAGIIRVIPKSISFYRTNIAGNYRFPHKIRSFPLYWLFHGTPEPMKQTPEMDPVEGI